MNQGLLVLDIDKGFRAVACPTCGTEQSSQMTYMSAQGGGDWCRCRNCGKEFTKPEEDAEGDWASWLQQATLGD